MRFAMFFAAACAAALSAVPAQAVVTVVDINAALTGSMLTASCNNAPSCFVTTPYSGQFARTLTLDLVEGANPFSIENPSMSERFGGTVIKNGDNLSGVGFSYVFDTCRGPAAAFPCVVTTATAATFQVTRVTPQVPEPASWAMLISGFGLLGAAARRRPTAVRFMPLG